jgi:hypothetical protein
LNWISLKYTPAKQDPSQLRKRLRSFDEKIIIDDEVVGADMKRSQLVQPQHVTFCDRSLLDALVAELTETLCTRYVPEPSNGIDEFLRSNLERLRSLESHGIDVSADLAACEEIIRTTDLAKWTECQKHLEKDSNWLVDTFNRSTVNHSLEEHPCPYALLSSAPRQLLSRL